LVELLVSSRVLRLPQNAQTVALVKLQYSAKSVTIDANRRA